jgi:hypothetical protein
LDEEPQGQTAGDGGSDTGGRNLTQGRGSGALQTEKEKADEELKANTTKVKAREEGDGFENEKGTFGSAKERRGKGGCRDIDLKVILQIAFIVALLFLLASMLFQKRDDSE